MPPAPSCGTTSYWGPSAGGALEQGVGCFVMIGVWKMRPRWDVDQSAGATRAGGRLASWFFAM